MFLHSAGGPIDSRAWSASLSGFPFERLHETTRSGGGETPRQSHAQSSVSSGTYLFHSHKWTLRFVDAAVESDFIVYFMMRRLFILACQMPLIIAAVLSAYVNRTDHLALILHLTCFGAWTLTFAASLALALHTHQLALSNLPSVDVLRTNAQWQYRINIVVFLIAIVYTLTIIAGRRRCPDRVPTSSLGNLCYHAIQNDAMALVIPVLVMQLLPVRCVELVIMIMGVLVVILGLPWWLASGPLSTASVNLTRGVVALVEIVVATWCAVRREVDSRSGFRAHVACQQHTLQLQQVKQRTEQLAQLQFPVVAVEALQRGGADGNGTHCLWWSNEAVCAVICIDRFREWSSNRGPFDTIQLLERLTVLIDAQLVRTTRTWSHALIDAPPCKYHSFGDAYVIAWFSSHGASTRGATAVADLVVECLAAGSSLIEEVLPRLPAADERRSVHLRLRGGLSLGECGAFFTAPSRNAIVIGPAVTSAYDEAKHCTNDDDDIDTKFTLSIQPAVLPLLGASSLAMFIHESDDNLSAAVVPNHKKLMPSRTVLGDDNSEDAERRRSSSGIADDDESSMQRPVSATAQADQGILWLTFSDRAMEKEYLEYRATQSLKKGNAIPSLLCSVGSFAALAFGCSWDMVNRDLSDGNKPFVFIIAGASVCLGVALGTWSLSKRAWKRYAQAVIATTSVIAATCYAAAVFVAPRGTLVGNSMCLWAVVISEWALHRPLWGGQLTLLVFDVICAALFSVRAMTAFPSERSSPLVTASVSLIALIPGYLIALRLVDDRSSRAVFAMEHYVKSTKVALADDYNRLESALQQLVPHGAAGRLVERSRQHYRVATRRRRMHFWWSTSFGTSTEETPFVVIHIRTTDSQLSPRESADVVVACAETLHALTQREPWSGVMELVKTSGPALVFCARVPSRNERVDGGKGGSRDEQRAISALTFASWAIRLLRENIAVEVRAVVGCGYLTGAVVGRHAASFEYHGPFLSRGMVLCNELEWGTVVATQRILRMAEDFSKFELRSIGAMRDGCRDDAASRTKQLLHSMYRGVGLSSMSLPFRCSGGGMLEHCRWLQFE